MGVTEKVEVLKGFLVLVFPSRNSCQEIGLLGKSPAGKVYLHKVLLGEEKSPHYRLEMIGCQRASQQRAEVLEGTMGRPWALVEMASDNILGIIFKVMEGDLRSVDIEETMPLSVFTYKISQAAASPKRVLRRWGSLHSSEWVSKKRLPDNSQLVKAC